MSFWRPVSALLCVRLTVARNAFKRNPTAQLASLLFTAMFALSALGMGGALAREWSSSTPARAANSLEGVLLVVLVVLAAAYAAPGSISLMGPLPQESVLCPFPLSRLQRVVAELLTCLLDVPTLLAILVGAPLISQFINFSGPAPVAVTLTAGFLMAVLAGLAVRVIARIGLRFVRRCRRLIDVPAMTSLLFISSSIALPPAFAALSAPTVIGSNHPSLSTQTDITVARMVSPAHLAANSVAASVSGDGQQAAANLAALAVEAALCFTLALSAAGSAQQKRLLRPTILSKHWQGKYPLQRTVCRASSRTGAWIQLAALVTTEVKLLLRQPQNFLSLHKPAAMILVGFFALLAPDMGRNPVYSAKELLSISTVLYPLMWQIQLLCNRFGADAGKASLIFGFSLDRRILILGKNLALLLLLAALNSGALSGLDCVIGEPGAISPMLIRLPVILLLATSFGNLVSVLQPFAIPRFAGDSAEPPNYLIAVYSFIILATALITYWVMPLSGEPTLNCFAGSLLIFALYFGSVIIAAKRLVVTERSVIAKLDGGE